jgi:uncharacterized membrane protein YeaQ/YmgE (transglycosylase-associated protein family)
MLSLILELVLGAAAGWIASNIMGKEKNGLVIDCILGIVGSILGGFIFNLLGFSAAHIWGQLIIAVVGACLVIWIYNKFFASK